MQKHRDLLLVTLAIVVATGTLIVAILLWPYPQASGETPRSSTGAPTQT